MNSLFEKLKKYGIKIPKYKIFSIDEEIDFSIFPAVLKIDSKKVIHKSDVGGVKISLNSKEELNEAKKEIIDSLNKKNIYLDENDKFIVQEMIKGEEFYIGGVYDKVFEEILVFGKGGVLLEAEKDICYIDSEADDKEILKSFKKTKISKIFPKFRNKEYKIEFVLDIVKKFQKLFINEDILEFDINPLIYTENGFVAVDIRVKEGKKEKKTKHKREFDIFENKNIAIFGATNKKEKVGYALSKNALNSDANIYFVNPKLEKLFEKRVYHSLEELPKIDTAIIAIPSTLVIELVEKLAKKGVKNIVIISAGFKEIGNIKEEEKLTNLAKRYNLNIIGPNCLGIYNGKYHLNLTFGTDIILDGELALISQSGAVLSALMDKASKYSIGFSHILSLGNMADFDFSDAIKSLDNKKECKYISLYAEGLKNGKEYLRSIRSLKKPILVYKAGKTKEAKKAAFSHTGNISGDYEMFYNLSYSVGAIIKNDIDELLFAPKYNRFKDIIIVTNAGGPGTILADIVVKNGKKLKELPKDIIEKLNSILPSTWSHNNPIDIIGDATSKRYKDTLDLIISLDALILVVVTPQFMTDSLNIAKIIKEYKNTIPIFFGGKKFDEVYKYFEKENILYFDDLENVANIL